MSMKKPMLAVEVDLSKVKYPVSCTGKYDGCFTRSAKIWTEKGSIPIGDIVDKNLEVKVASFNEETGDVEFKKIVNRFCNGSKPSSEWLSFKGATKITKNHKIYSNGEWVRADSYKYGGICTDDRLGGFITGMLLGDSVAVIDKRHKLSWRLSWSVSKSDVNYGDAKADMISDILDGGITKKSKVSGYGSDIEYFITKSCTNLPFDLSRFYVTNFLSESFGKRKKNLTTKDLELFDDLSLAIWFFDDGTVSYNNGNAKTPRLMFSIPRYSESTREVFKKLFKTKYNVTPSITKSGKDVSMTFDTPSSWMLLARIASVAGDMCNRKIPKIFNPIPYVKLRSMELNPKLLLKELKGSKSYKAYDLEVEDNHNYFADGVLVHNCRATVQNGVVLSRSLKPIRNKHVQALFGRDCFNDLDGELIVGSPVASDVFQKTTSGVMASEGCPEVSFYVFDYLDSEMSYKNRLEYLRGLSIYNNDVKLVKTYIANTEKELLDIYDSFLQAGYEGVMVRSLDKGYKHGRSTANSQHLLKLKPFKDAEAVVVGFEERMHNNNEAITNELGYTERSSAKENLVATDSLGALVVDYEGVSFKIGTGFNEEQRQEIWKNRDRYVGKLVKFKYQEIGVKDLPRFPSFIGWRNEEDL